MTKDILARYQQAQDLMHGSFTTRVAMNDVVFAHWIGDAHFWYTRQTKTGKEFRLVDAKAARNTLAFDHKALAKLLTKAVGRKVDHKDLPIKDVSITLSPLQVRFQALDKKWLFQAGKKALEEREPVPDGLLSPDGKKLVFTRDHNLWLRDTKSGDERALTTDGTEDYCYARAHIEYLCGVQALWSPDSSRVFTVQLDARQAVSRPLVEYVPGDDSFTPRVTMVKRSYPGDEHLESYRVLSIDTNTGQQTAADYRPVPFSGYGYGFFRGKSGWWAADSRRAYFLDVTRGAKAVRVVEFDTHTGATRILFEETSDTFVKLCHTSEDFPLFTPLPKTDELVWFSERTGWGQLYLYDLNTGKLKHAITKGRWLVRDVLHCDAKRRELLVQTAGRDAGVSPYYCDISKINIDTKALTPLVSGNFEHGVFHSLHSAPMIREMMGVESPGVSGVSPTGRYVVTTRSRIDTVPVSLLVDRNGKEVLTVETADVSGLPSDWVWPEPVKLKAADRKTDVYGAVFRPPGFSPDQKYPVVTFACGGRGASVFPQGSFNNDPLFGYSYLSAAAIAALGFVVVAMDGRGGPRRNKAFQDHNYGDPASTSDPADHVAGLRQLAKRYPYMDLERVGISGMDASQTAVYGLLTQPDFYKVGVVHCFWDSRFGPSTMGEMYDGMSGDKAAMSKMRHAENLAGALKGKLFLICGILEFSTPAGTFRLVEALRKANKKFDMLCLPNLNTNINTFALRCNWDYLVEHLQGIKPPDFHLTSGEEELLKTVDFGNLGSSE